MEVDADDSFLESLALENMHIGEHTPGDIVWSDVSVAAVLGEVLGNGSSGGLTAIVAKLQQAGLGDQVKSWLGNGQNLPITAQQLQEVLGSDTVKQLAARYNIPRGSRRSMEARKNVTNCRLRPSPSTRSISP